MTDQEKFDRRHFLEFLGGAMLLGAAPGFAMAREKNDAAVGAFSPDLELELRAGQDRVNILPGVPTAVWRYRAKVLKGDPKAVAALPGSYLGPIIRVRRGTRVRVHFINDLPQPSVVHWHGLIVPEAMDGHPRHAVAPGERYVYEFEVRNRAGTYWFHPHPHQITGVQVYGGLAGLFIVSDEEEQALNLPSGERDIPLVIQDRSFSGDNQLRYLGNAPGMSAMMGRMTGFVGEHVLVNGRPSFALDLGRKVYRLRLLNGSNSRIYKLAWDDGTPLMVIGTDGGLLEAPVRRGFIALAPAERVELWVDLSARKAGEQLALRSLPLPATSGSPMMGGMMGGMVGGVGDNDPITILSVRIAGDASAPETLPTRLTQFKPLKLGDAANRSDPRRFRITMGGMRWGLNGRVFDTEDVARDEVVRLGTTEIWEFANDAAMGGMGGMMGGMMMGMPHPMHVHGVQFRIVGRSLARGHAAAVEELSAGYVDEGWKDTVLVMPGERVRLLMRFADYPGLFLYHCHNLEHEDMGMMRNFQIKA